jgi:DNA adenine methylase
LLSTEGCGLIGSRGIEHAESAIEHAQELMSVKTEQLTSFLKWAGGKRWLVNRYADLFPKNYERYFEPFVGSGSVFFALKPSRGQISDKNSELINLYKALKSSPNEVWRSLQRHALHHSDSYYYRVRASKPRSEVGKASRMLYLNRACWNGLYRVNLQGEFNVPRGTKNTIVFEQDDFNGVAAALRNIGIRCGDFEKSIDAAENDDFLFLDPPYTVSHNNNGFIKYNESLFTWDDQVRLCQAVQRASDRGVKILLTNADHKPIRDMYRPLGKLHALPRASVISGSSAGRKLTTELAVRINYP